MSASVGVSRKRESLTPRNWRWRHCKEGPLIQHSRATRCNGPQHHGPTHSTNGTRAWAAARGVPRASRFDQFRLSVREIDLPVGLSSELSRAHLLRTTATEWQPQQLPSWVWLAATLPTVDGELISDPLGHAARRRGDGDHPNGRLIESRRSAMPSRCHVCNCK